MADARLRYVQPDGRGVMKRKYSVEKGEGPVVLLAEWLCKEMIRSKWPCEVVAVLPQGGAGHPERVTVRPLAPVVDFEAFSEEARITLLAIAGMQKHLVADHVSWEAGCLSLLAEYHVNHRGQIRRGPWVAPRASAARPARRAAWHWRGPGT